MEMGDEAEQGWHAYGLELKGAVGWWKIGPGSLQALKLDPL